MPITSDNTILPMKPEFKNKHDKRCFDEATKDVIFILQWRRIIPTDISNYEYDSDLDCVVDQWGTSYTNDELLEVNGAVAIWVPESVWLDRDEAEEYGKAHAYNWGKGRKGIDWMVYGIHTEGGLSKLLRSAE